MRLNRIALTWGAIMLVLGCNNLEPGIETVGLVPATPYEIMHFTNRKKEVPYFSTNDATIVGHPYRKGVDAHWLMLKGESWSGWMKVECTDPGPNVPVSVDGGERFEVAGFSISQDQIRGPIPTSSFIEFTRAPDGKMGAIILRENRHEEEPNIYNCLVTWRKK